MTFDRTLMFLILPLVTLGACSPNEAFKSLAQINLSQELTETSTETPNHFNELQETLKTYPLSWEKRRPAAVSWSQITLTEVDKHFQTLDQVKDATTFCPRYYSLSKDLRKNFWGQLISAMAYYESGWNPYTRFLEKELGIDRVTKQPVYSEGLLQLSYQDKLIYPWCDFDWNRDKHLSPTDPRKTIFDPKRNLSCGIGIMAHQIRRHGNIVIGRGAYWAVIKSNSKYQKIPQIRSMILRHANYCL